MDPIAHSPASSPRPAGPRRPRRVAAAALAFAAAAAAALALAAPARPAGTNVTMVGRGWGHGIGMSQWGAYGYAKHDWTFDQILKHYYTGIKLGKVDNDPIRVRLRGGLATVRLTCANAYEAAVTGSHLDIPAGVTAVVSWVGGKYKVTAGDRAKTFGSPVTFRPLSGQIRTVTADDWGKTGKYRGVIRVLHASAGFTIVNRLPMESYLRGVVPLEMSASWPLEALKAQACAARAYAQRSRNPGEVFDVYCTTRDQAYGGMRVEAAQTNAAVTGSARIVPTYNGTPIAAFYFSTSGGHTENVENVWQTSPIPYLKGVEDPYDTASPLHFWPDNPIVHTAGWYEDKLGSYGQNNPTGVRGDLRAIVVVKRGVSPRVVRAALVGSNGVTLVSGASLRYKLALRDTWVTFTSMSLAADSTTVTYDVGTRLRGRVYPALKDGASVTLRYLRGGDWKSLTVTTTRHAQEVGSGVTATYSSFAYAAKPPAATTYYVTSGKARSPKVTLKVRPAVSIAASETAVAVGQVVTFSGATKPLLPGATVWLQTRSGDAWVNAVSGKLNADGGYSFDWTAVAGVTAARVRVPSTAGFVAGSSAAVALTVGD